MTRADRGRVGAGLALVVAIALIVGLSVGLFRGSFTETVPLTVVSPRAGLVMNPDAKVKMRGVQVGTVASIESRPDGTAVLHLAMDPAQLRRIPANVNVDIASSTVFGAKFVQLENPPDPSPEPVRPGATLQGDHVTVEINTVFQQLTQLLDSIDPLKVNETLGAISDAFNGRGEQFGRTLTDFNNFLAKIEPSLDNLATITRQLPPVLTAYADGAQDLVTAVDNTSTLSNSIVEERDNLDAFLISATGLADVGIEVVGGNRQALRDLAHILLPTSELLAKYHEGLGCGIGGIVPFSKSTPFNVPGIIISAGLTLGVERYRYPQDLPRVAAKAERSYCKEYGLPDVPPEYRVPMLVADTGANPYQYGNQGILLNSDGLKQMLFGPLNGPPRNSAQVGMPG
ncbi:MCE family protein [Mycobacterium sp. MBM]|nr:MCE family protein [Mycobacterium sp. MBM]